MFCLYHASISLTKKTITLLLAKLLVVDGVSLAIVLVFGKKKYYWICDYNSIKEILEYTRSVHQLRCWSQELFGYDFSIIRRSKNIMKNINVLSHNIKHLIHQYLVTASSCAVVILNHALLCITTICCRAVQTYAMCKLLQPY